MNGDTPTTRGPLVTWFAVVLVLTIAAALQVLVYGAPHLWHFGRYGDWVASVALPAFFLLPFIAFGAVLGPIRALYPGKRSAVVLLALLAVMATYVGVCVAFNLFGT